MRLQEGKTIKLDEILKSVNSRTHQDVQHDRKQCNNISVWIKKDKQFILN